MLFNSFQFLFFFLIVWVLVLSTRGKTRKVILLIASYYFYMCWNAKYILVIWAITLIDYFAGLEIGKAEEPSRRRFFLGISLAANIGLLAFFKYFNFLTGSVWSAGRFFGLESNPPLLAIILPVGLSFHTFQAMSYTIDVYKRKVPPEKHLLEYALYVAFFPQMVAGPIERPNRLLPQFHRDPRVTSEGIRSGLAQAMWGLFKKIVLADNVSEFVKLIYASPRQFDGAELLLATFLFSVQIYCDFSGYTDMAIGVARMMGYNLAINFRQPYFSKNIAEFWHRWHISLSTWFRDYTYIPLGGNRVGTLRRYFNLMVTFIVSGLWHGANWTFVVWGALHGMYLVVYLCVRPWASRAGRMLRADRFPRLVNASKMLLTFALVTIAWAYFRAGSISDAWYITWHLFPLGTLNPYVLKVGSFTRATMPALALLLVLMFAVEWIIAHPELTPRVWRSPVFRALCYNACIFAIAFYGFYGHRDFIYFQF